MQYVREVFRLLGDDMAYQELGKLALDYALVWIRFVLGKTERGRGTRPRWVIMWVWLWEGHTAEVGNYVGVVKGGHTDELGNYMGVVRGGAHS